MKANEIENAWIPMQDYVVGGVRKKREPNPSLIKSSSIHPNNENWISVSDYWLKGAKSTFGPLEEEDPYIRLIPELEKKPTPLEAWWTVYSVLAEIYKVLDSEGGMNPRLDAMRRENQKDLNIKLISSETYRQRESILDGIRERHLIEMDNAVSWYLDTFFRLFESASLEETIHCGQLR